MIQNTEPETIGNSEVNVTIVNGEKFNVGKCADCGAEMEINVEAESHLLSWCVLCAGKLTVGEFNEKKELLGLNRTDIQKWFDTGSFQFIETEEEFFIIKIKPESEDRRLAADNQ